MTGITSLPTSAPGHHSGSARHVARGRIILVQEARFRLWTADGKGLLLTLAHNANVGIEDLLALHRDGAEVEVHYSGTPNLAQASAHRIRQIHPVPRRP